MEKGAGLVIARAMAYLNWRDTLEGYETSVHMVEHQLLVQATDLALEKVGDEQNYTRVNINDRHYA